VEIGRSVKKPWRRVAVAGNHGRSACEIATRSPIFSTAQRPRRPIAARTRPLQPPVPTLFRLLARPTVLSRKARGGGVLDCRAAKVWLASVFPLQAGQHANLRLARFPCISSTRASNIGRQYLGDCERPSGRGRWRQGWCSRCRRNYQTTTSGVHLAVEVPRRRLARYHVACKMCSRPTRHYDRAATPEIACHTMGLPPSLWYHWPKQQSLRKDAWTRCERTPSRARTDPTADAHDPPGAP
jgi:hypothetical protein